MGLQYTPGMPRRALAALAVLLVAAGTARGQDVTAADVTERGRDLPAILDLSLAAAGGGPGVLVVLLDPTPSLAQSRFADEFEAALGRQAEALSATAIAVVRAGDEGPALIAPTKDRAAAAAAVRKALDRTDLAFRNVYGDVRRAASLLAGADGKREMLLVTLENGDAEDEAEATAGLLERGRIRLSAIAREAFLSDSYWLERASSAPRGFDLAGGDAAFVELPWGWLFQQRVANQNVASGFPMFGIARLAAASGGRVFLYYPSPPESGTCGSYGCPFCDQDHLACAEPYASHRLKVLAPSVASRARIFAGAGADPYLRATLAAWGQAAKKGLLRSRPSVAAAGSSLRPERRQTGIAATVGSSLNFDGEASRAEALAREAARILADLEVDLAAAEAAGGGSERQRAIAELVRVHLAITRLNLLSFAAFCREVGPPQLAKIRNGVIDPPEDYRYSDGFRITGIGYSMIPLCHGVKAFRDLELPGGEAMRREYEALGTIVEGFLARHARTPFAEAVRRSGVAKFYFAGVGRLGPPPPRPIGHKPSDSETTTPDRPSRGGATSGGASGPTSGGDR